MYASSLEAAFRMIIVNKKSRKKIQARCIDKVSIVFV